MLIIGIKQCKQKTFSYFISFISNRNNRKSNNGVQQIMQKNIHQATLLKQVNMI